MKNVCAFTVLWKSVFLAAIDRRSVYYIVSKIQNYKCDFKLMFCGVLLNIVCKNQLI